MAESQPLNLWQQRPQQADRSQRRKSGNNITEQQAFQERQKFVNAFNDTMLKIWQEQITLLGLIDTGALLASPKAFPVRADGRFFEVGISQAFLEICD